MSGNKNILVSIEGNVGSGKSTFLDHIQHREDIEILLEPLEKWCNLGQTNLLKSMYSDPSRWTFQFQSYVQLTRLQLLTKPQEKRVKMIERSLQSNRFVYLEVAKQRGTLFEDEHRCLVESYDEIAARCSNAKLDYIIYLRSSPETAFRRMVSRGRMEESKAKLDYLTSLHNAYEEWLSHNAFGPLGCELIVIDADKNLEEVKEQIATKVDPKLFPLIC